MPSRHGWLTGACRYRECEPSARSARAAGPCMPSRGFLLTDWVAEIDGAYRPDEHVVCWRTMGELREKVAYYLAHEDERRTIAARGHEHFLRHHTYAVRARELLEHLR